jgi:hypothetical protein
MQLVFRRTERIKFSEFMSGEYNGKVKGKKERRKADKAALASASLIPVVAFTPKVLAASAPVAMTAAAPVAITTTGAMDNLAHIFDPLIDLVVGISFPVASAMILFKLFMGFFVGQDQVWEGVGKISLVYVLIQMFPVFSEILHNLGKMV